METILVAAAVVAGLGLVLGIGLSVASVLLKAKVNELEQQLIEVLPGINCGACSFPGCAEYAKALATGKVKTTLCPVGGDEGVKKICEILGVEASKATKRWPLFNVRAHLSIRANQKITKELKPVTLQVCYVMGRANAPTAATATVTA